MFAVREGKGGLCGSYNAAARSVYVYVLRETPNVVIYNIHGQPPQKAELACCDLQYLPAVMKEFQMLSCTVSANSKELQTLSSVCKLWLSSKCYSLSII